jgi:pimeloyl-ACP methyl ester carboxylesterase
MSDVVLVHGAWHGSWCWRRVVPALWAAGHRVLPVTLTGLGERAHQLSTEVTLANHVADVVTAVRAEECRNAVLVGHSAAGLVITAAADQLGDAVGPLVYVDGFVPEPGESWSTLNTPETQAERRASIARLGVIPPPPVAAFGLSGDDGAWVERRMTPNPGAVYDAPVDFDVAAWAVRPRTFVDCTTPALATIDPFRARVRSQPGWRVVELATGHDPMISAPEELAAVLLEVAGG